MVASFWPVIRPEIDSTGFCSTRWPQYGERVFGRSRRRPHPRPAYGRIAAVLYLIIALTLFILSFVAGMMGLGVAFIATPVLGLFGFELKHVIMPWSLWLNGLTAISGAIAFARAKMVDWRTAIPLLVITTITAPIGV